MIIHALHDYVVIEELKGEDMSEGGIYIPDSEKDSQRGEVLHVGPGRLTDHGVLIETQLKVGDKVLFDKYKGARIVRGKQKFFVLKASEILATYTEE